MDAAQPGFVKGRSGSDWNDRSGRGARNCGAGEMKTMDKMHTVVAVLPDWPTGLRDAESIAVEIGTTAERLNALADAGFAPHYRIDGSKALFKTSELKKWAARNLVEHVAGKDIPDPVKVVLDADRIKDYRKVPPAIREIENLRDITGEISRIGIYFLCFNGEVVYVGQSVQAASRIKQHIHTKVFTEAYFLAWPRDDLNRIEGALIRSLRPRLNGQTPTGHMVGVRLDMDEEYENVLLTIKPETVDA